MTLFYFPNPDEPCGSVGCYLQKGNVCWELPGGSDCVKILIWIEDIKKDFLCMFIICLWFSVGAAAMILYGGTPRNRFKHSDFKSVFMSSGHLNMSLVGFFCFFFLVHSQEIICHICQFVICHICQFVICHICLSFPYYLLLPQTDSLCTARVMIVIKSYAYVFITTVLWVSETGMHFFRFS